MLLSTAVRHAVRQPTWQRSLSTAAAKASPTLKVEVKNAGPSAAELKEERKETMTKAAASKQSGKSGWQKFVSGVLDVIRPACAAVHTPVMKVLDAPSRRRVQKAASVEDLRIAAEKRMHAMCYGYLRAAPTRRSRCVEAWTATRTWSCAMRCCTASATARSTLDDDLGPRGEAALLRHVVRRFRCGVLLVTSTDGLLDGVDA